MRSRWEKVRPFIILAGVLGVASQAGAYSLLGYKWDVGVGTAEVNAGNLGTAGGATWSVMAAGLAADGDHDPHSGHTTTSLSSLYAGGTLSEIEAIEAAIDTWAAVCNFTNLGMVADGGGAIGAPGAAGGVGDMRFGAIYIDGSSGANVLAHAYAPGTEALWGTHGGRGGDVHFDDSNSWSDGGGAGTFDFYTVALHEIGHALGLGHSTVSGSVMEAVYAGPRRTLHADDIAGIQEIYGAAPVPEPATLVLAGAALLAGARRRKRSA